jgi:dynein heavy chain
MHNGFDDFFNFQGGPMVPDLLTSVVNDRLVIFQTRFDHLWAKYQLFASSEELFGLPVTEYPELRRIRKELGLLQKLYGLYNDVNIAVMSYSDVMWADVKIDRINQQLQGFDARY